MNLINNYSDLNAFLSANVGTIVPFENLAQFTEVFNSTFIQGSNALKLLPEEMGQIIEFIPNLTGGTDAGAVINDVVQNPATGAVTSTVAGGLLACPATQVVAGVMLMMGVKFATEAIKKEVTNRCIRYLEDDAGATQEQIDKLMYPVFINPYVPVIEEPETRVWSTALSLKIVNKINEFLQQDDAYTPPLPDSIVEYEFPQTTGTYTFNGSEPTDGNIRAYLRYLEEYTSSVARQININNPTLSDYYDDSNLSRIMNVLVGLVSGNSSLEGQSPLGINLNDYDSFQITMSVRKVQDFGLKAYDYNVELFLFNKLDGYIIRQNMLDSIEENGYFLPANESSGYGYYYNSNYNADKPHVAIEISDWISNQNDWMDVTSPNSRRNKVTTHEASGHGYIIGKRLATYTDRMETSSSQMCSLNSSAELATESDYELVDGYEHPTDGVTLADIFPSLSPFITHGIINGIEKINEYVRINPRLFYDYDNLVESIGDISQDTLAIGDILPDVVPAIEALPAPNILEVANPVTQPNPNADPDLPISNPTVTTTGGTPIIALPTLGSGGKMFTVYNPTQEELDDIGGKLWSTSIWDVIKSWFQSPLDCIIGLSVIYINPTISSTKHDVYFGSLDSDVNSYVVTNQFSSLDCGTCAIPETFGNATDYKPYTSVSIFLPFIGFRDLDIDDVMGSTLHVKYKIDVFTGSCLATIDVTRNGITQTLYQFAGDCSFDLPVTARDRTNLLKAIPAVVGASAVGGAVGTIAGITGIANGLRENVRRTGSFTGSTGAMGGKKPFVVINRTEPYDANNYNNLYGFPSNKRVTLGSMVGFTKVKDVHVEGIACTENEKLLIESALKEGVML